MAYQANIPQPGDKIKDSQADLLGDFIALKSLIDVNHETFGASDEGKHKWVALPVQGSAPTTAAGEVAIYSTTSSLTGVSELSVKADLAGTAVEFTSKTEGTNGWTRLPSGILIKWGTTSTLTAGANTITLPTGVSIQAFATIYNIQVSAQSDGSSDPSSAMYPSAVDELSFKIWVVKRSTGAIGTPLVGYYFIIGI